eukprot:g6894.t1
MFAVLLFTVLITPVEAAFLEPQYNALFWVNRVIDLVFAVDIVLNFFIAYRQPDGKWVTNKRLIARRYVRGWLAIDVISIIPFDLIALLAENKELGPGQAVRFLRMLRLIKMITRLSRSKRILQRYEEFTTLSFAQLSLAKFALTVLIAAHWISCLWRIVLEFQMRYDSEKKEKTCTRCWFEQYNQVAAGDVKITTNDVLELYIICLYWAISTLSTIGYGDTANPVNLGERIVGIVAMVIGSTLWAYVMGKMAGVLSSFDEPKLVYERQMDKVHHMAQHHMLPSDLRLRLRTYYTQRQTLTQTIDTQGLLSTMSPSLRGEVAVQIMGRWLCDVDWVSHGSRGFLASVALALRAVTFEALETIVGPDLNVVMRGVVTHRSRCFPSGFAWGQDIILSNRKLKG